MRKIEGKNKSMTQNLKLKKGNLMYNTTMHISGAFSKLSTSHNAIFSELYKLDRVRLSLSAEFTVISYQTAVDLVFHVLNKSL